MDNAYTLLEMRITICITMAHTDTYSCPRPTYKRRNGESFLRQKLANLNAALGFGRIDQHGAATFKSRKDTSVGLIVGQALNPARPTSLKTVTARPEIRPGQEDVKSRRRLIKGDQCQLLRNYVSMRRRPEHAPSNPATT